MKKQADHKRVMSFLKTIRNAFPDASIVFTFGACYGLYQILHEIFPSARPFMTEERNHIVTRIDGKFYDVYGEYVNLDGKPKSKMAPLTAQQKEHWEANAEGQRLEYMLKKYKR